MTQIDLTGKTVAEVIGEMKAGATLPPTVAEYGLVMPQSVRDSLLAVQEQYGQSQHRLAPRALTDGRWALKADALTEAREDGVFGCVEYLDPENVALVDVVPWPEVAALLPVPVEEDE